MSNRKGKKTVTSGEAFGLGGSDEVVPPDASSVDTDELDASLKREQGRVRVAVGRDAGHKPLKETTEFRREEADRQAIERGENEGMIAGPE